jgi:RNA polymerase sigma factor (sigma-70 family)
MAVDPQHAIEAVWRIESARLIGGLARIVRDVGMAEELAQDALVAALEEWPRSGIPDKPGAWLMATARRRAIDQIRRARMAERKHDELARERAAVRASDDVAAAVDNSMWARAQEESGDDDVLRLIFMACHPALSTEARVALTLRLVGGLTTTEIARAFLVREPAIAQRIVRAKRFLVDQHIPFEVPGENELGLRLSSVLEVVYLIFNEGYTATSGGDWMRPALCEDALRLGRMLARLMPNEPEVFGLVALMEIQASRLNARTSASGEPILLPDQNRLLWDRLLIRRGLSALARAEALRAQRGAYVLQAAIAACHARASTAAATDWAMIAQLYGELQAAAPSPVVELNRAVAVAMAVGPAAGLQIVDALVASGELATYHLLPSVRGTFLFELGRLEEARAEFERAAGLTANERERNFLLKKARSCGES